VSISARSRHWLLLPIIAALLLWLAPARVVAADNNGVLSPAAGTSLSGTVAILGKAVHPTFRKWQLDILRADDQQAHFLALGERPQAEPGELFQLDTRALPNGEYVLRLRVVHSNLNYDEFYTPVTIANAGAPASEATDTAAETIADPTAESAAAEETTAAPAPIEFRTDAPADGKRWVEVDLSDQALTAWQGDVPVFQTTVSTGKPGYRTLPGTFHVYVKYPVTRMRGADYDTPDVPWTMYYYGGFALHGAYWHDKFGTPVSHGCVNLRVPEAEALFNWAEVGTEVVVHE
jgi:lipoprotein-anchoring transpeptidase ErfK/SrfK